MTSLFGFTVNGQRHHITRRRAVTHMEQILATGGYTGLHRHSFGAEESGGALAESLAFRGAGKRGKLKSRPNAQGSEKLTAGNPGTGGHRGSRPTAEQGFSVYCGGATRSGEHRGAEAGFGADQRRKRRWETWLGAAGGVPGPTGVGGVICGVRGGDSG
ncbi:hypothetical protein PGT21_031742 [Puccinia graminis f. sp. tritici]|uniref:Uncharacterized protein n=1 Tax=Puccinia graminis f. sp. tritici TaxID=56615 RepID=A0A5B0MEZ4_PUCGR|nr:hypothetical protein PGT21_031742 [Puccinia graminis f. sp. tritici]